MTERASAPTVRARDLMTTVTVILALAAGTAGVAATTAASALAAEQVTGSERTAMARAAASSSAGEGVDLRIDGRGQATMAPLTLKSPATLVAVRSSVSRSWGLLVALPHGRVDHRQTFLLQRRSGSWRVRMSASRGQEGERICARRTPGTAVVLDLGLTASTWSGGCRHKRERRGLVRQMTAGELASVRSMVEWRYDEVFNLVPGPVQPRETDVQTSDCAWDGRGSVVDPPYGEVARSSPAWGAVTITCVIGTDGFGLLESPTILLVARAGGSGPFTRAMAHTLPSWSSRGSLCSTERRWSVPPDARVALRFCTPYPLVLPNALL